MTAVCSLASIALNSPIFCLLTRRPWTFRLIIDVAEVEGRGEVVEDGVGEDASMERLGLTRPTPAKPGVEEQGRTGVDLVLILGLGRSDGLDGEVEAVVDVVVDIVVGVGRVLKSRGC